MYGQSSDSANEPRSQQLPSRIVAKEFGEVNVRNTGEELQVLFTILMEPQGEKAEGWQTGVALDASASMKDFYGRKLEGKVPPDVAADYEKKGWIESHVEEGRRVKVFQKKLMKMLLTGAISSSVLTLFNLLPNNS